MRGGRTIDHSNIQAQTSDDGRHSTSLYQESEDVATDEDSRQPGGTDRTIALAMCGLNYCREDHVNGCCKEGWAEEEK